MPISLRQKLKALKEVENIYRLSKKALPPQGTTWARVADKVLRKALGEPIEEAPESLNVTEDGQMHQHSPRTARIVERTLRNGIVHPDVLHSYRNDKVEQGSTRVRYEKPLARPDSMPVQHYVQHGGTDLEYPSGHLQLRLRPAQPRGRVPRPAGGRGRGDHHAGSAGPRIRRWPAACNALTQDART